MFYNVFILLLSFLTSSLYYLYYVTSSLYYFLSTCETVSFVLVYIFFLYLYLFFNEISCDAIKPVYAKQMQ